MATGRTRSGTFVTTIRSRNNPAIGIMQECALWLRESVEDVRDMAKYLVSGVLLKKVTGGLANSIHSEVNPLTLYGEVKSHDEKAVIWDHYGMKGPIRVNQHTGQDRSFARDGQAPTGHHRAIVLMKSASVKGSLGSQTRFRQATYTRVTFKPPVEFMRKATELQMLGNTGRARLRSLGVNVGRIVARDVVNGIVNDYAGGAVTVRGSSL